MKYFDSKIPKRFDLYDLKNLNSYESLTLLPLAEEYYLACPVKGRKECISYYGTTSWGDVCLINIRLEPRTDEGNEDYHLTNASVEMHFYLQKPQPSTYYYCENEFIELDKFADPFGNITKYRIGSLLIEHQRLFMTTRFVFRGFLQNYLENRKIFANIHLLASSCGKIFDNLSDFNLDFMKKQFKGKKIECEDSFEQWIQIRGKMDLENDKESRDLYFWGINRKSFEIDPITVNHLFIWNHKGMGIHIEKHQNSSIVFGHVNIGLGLNSALTEMPTFLTPETLEDVEKLDFLKFSINLKKESKSYLIEIDSYENFTQFNGNLWSFPVKLNTYKGYGLFWKENLFVDENLLKLSPKQRIFEKNMNFSNDLVVSLNDGSAKNENLTGGKGSSLAILNELSYQASNSFKVPMAVIVTTEGYKTFLEQNSEVKFQVEQFSSRILECEGDQNLIKEQCEIMQNAMKNTELPENIKNSLKMKIFDVFGDEESVKNEKFAVRSSAVGEDSQEMSAAGQMTTFLGVSGLSSIYKSIIACWSSQFSQTAVEYKRGYGQEINSLMGVVIQKMIPSNVSGVMFTCSPLDGNERFVSISSSYGLGESIVSGQVEPDTFTVKVDVESYPRSVVCIDNVQIGAKKIALHMNEDSTKTHQVPETERSTRSLNDHQVLQLARIGLEVHAYYGNSRDIEFALNNEEWFLLQSRPVTNFESLTEWEIMHELDSGQNSENDCFTRANVGEVFPGAMSYMLFNFTFKIWDVSTFRFTCKISGQDVKTFDPYFINHLSVSSNIIFLPLKSHLTLMGRKNPTDDSSFIRSFEYNLFGSRQKNIERFEDIFEKMAKKITPHETFKILFYVLKSLNKSHKDNKIAYEKYSNYSITIDDNMSSKDIFELFLKEVINCVEPYSNHMKVTNSSMFYNAILHSFIESKISIDDNESEVLGLFSKITSSISDVFSAQVPVRLNMIAKSIDDKDKFLRLSDDDSLKYLQNNSKEFKEFIQEYGHRGFKEFDLFAKQWEDDPIQLIHSLKSILNSNKDAKESANDEEENVKKYIENILEKYSFGSVSKSILYKYIIPKVHRGIRDRELGKNLLIRTNHQFRKLFNKLGQKMVLEGKIPQKELIFFMTLTELRQLILFPSSNPLTILNAKNRYRLHSKKDNLKWNEETMGYEMKPRDSEMTLNIKDDDLKLAGTPIFSGKVIARCCVAETLGDAKNIQSGDILITYSTDIGWSPYFAALSGLVTEIGGFLSHGAVIAREYGLPCLVGVDQATLYFNTGDTLLLDTTSGYVCRISQKEQLETISG